MTCSQHRYRRLAAAFSATLSALLAVLLAACQRVPPVTVVPGVSADLAQQRATLISALRYRLALEIPADPDADIPGTMAIAFELTAADTALQVDFREDAARLRSARANGEPVAIDFRDEHIVIPARHLRHGGNTLEFAFVAGPTSLNRNPDFLYTLFVPDRARTAFPLFDQPDLKATWELTLTLPATWQAVSAAPVLRVDTAGQHRTVHFAPSDRISSYVFSFVAGDFRSATRDVAGRPMTVLHRETDAAKAERNLDDIFRLHAAALAWLEEYTGIPYPYGKLDIALLPAHPYGGMEHVGAIQYRSESLMLDEGASDAECLRRASLIAHEVAHMWFGNLVTMRWFDDVWTKEVFANFMAAKIVNPSFPATDHDLDFLVSHHPYAYSVDRTDGANPIRQELANLNGAGQLYGPIIYDKAPIMMRQLERLLGESVFRDGLRDYLATFAHANASWPELIRILDRFSDDDVAAWSEVWVTTAGRPTFDLRADAQGLQLAQRDPAGAGRLWPQVFALLDANTEAGPSPLLQLRADAPATPLPATLPRDPGGLVLNADGYGYGLFPADARALRRWRDLDALPLAALLVNLHEQMLDRGQPAPAAFLEPLLDIAAATPDQLLLDLVLGQLQTIYWTLLSDEARLDIAPVLEARLWDAMLASDGESLRKQRFMAFADIALTPAAVQRIDAVWSGEAVLAGVPLAERDFIRLTRQLAIKRPEHADTYLRAQLARTDNPDQRRQLAYELPSLSGDSAKRAAFFASLGEAGNRATEAWVLAALANLHHPLRVDHAEAFLRDSLELLEEIQVTGDIFFPAGWLRATFRNHHSDAAVAVVQDFLDERPDYNPQLRMKILQAADPVLRANRLRNADY